MSTGKKRTLAGARHQAFRRRRSVPGLSEAEAVRIGVEPRRMAFTGRWHGR